MELIREVAIFLTMSRKSIFLKTLYKAFTLQRSDSAFTNPLVNLLFFTRVCWPLLSQTLQDPELFSSSLLSTHYMYTHINLCIKVHRHMYIARGNSNQDPDSQYRHTCAGHYFPIWRIQSHN